MPRRKVVLTPLSQVVADTIREVMKPLLLRDEMHEALRADILRRGTETARRLVQLEIDVAKLISQALDHNEQIARLTADLQEREAVARVGRVEKVCDRTGDCQAVHRKMPRRKKRKGRLSAKDKPLRKVRR